jgi:hypothetical protein
MKRPEIVFEDDKDPGGDPSGNVTAALEQLASLSAAFRAAAQKAPESVSLLRRAVDKPQWTKKVCENTAKMVDIASSALRRGDPGLCKALMFNAKRDFDEQARRHRKASGWLFVGKKHQELANDFAGYSKQAMKILDLLL